MTPLTERALLREGLLEVLDARKSGADLRAFIARLRDADLLALGALADAIRRDEVGEGVRVHLESIPENAIRARGLELLRAVAIARITGARGARVCVDFGTSGLEIAQVALGFGASDLAGPIANRRGLPIAEDARKKIKGQGMVSLKALQREEIATLVRRAGREPVFPSSTAQHTEAAP